MDFKYKSYVLRWQSGIHANTVYLLRVFFLSSSAYHLFTVVIITIITVKQCLQTTALDKYISLSYNSINLWRVIWITWVSLILLKGRRGLFLGLLLGPTQWNIFLSLVIWYSGECTWLFGIGFMWYLQCLC